MNPLGIQHVYMEPGPLYHHEPKTVDYVLTSFPERADSTYLIINVLLIFCIVVISVLYFEQYFAARYQRDIAKNKTETNDTREEPVAVDSGLEGRKSRVRAMSDEMTLFKSKRRKDRMRRRTRHGASSSSAHSHRRGRANQSDSAQSSEEASDVSCASSWSEENGDRRYGTSTGREMTRGHDADLSISMTSSLSSYTGKAKKAHAHSSSSKKRSSSVRRDRNAVLKSDPTDTSVRTSATLPNTISLPNLNHLDSKSIKTTQTENKSSERKSKRPNFLKRVTSKQNSARKNTKPSSSSSTAQTECTQSSSEYKKTSPTLHDQNNTLSDPVNNAQCKELQSELEKTQLDLNTNRVQYEELKVSQVASNARLNAIHHAKKSLMTSSKKKYQRMETTLKMEVKALEADLAVYRCRTRGSAHPEGAVLQARLNDSEKLIAELESKVSNGDVARMEMHNKLQEMRGNIQVYVRVRPFLPSDGVGTKAEEDTSDLSLSADCPSSPIEVAPDNLQVSITRPKGMIVEPITFNFDKIFSACEGQDQVFDEVSGFVQSALDGYHVCLFSYGQTGSGKTHTMQGSDNAEMRGIIPRAVEQILAHATERQRNQNWKFSVIVKFLEVYNEEIRDLLLSDCAGARRKQKSATGKPIEKITIRQKENNRIFVEGLSQVEIDVSDHVRGSKQLEQVLATAAKVRSVAATNMNAHSSRSHSVFILDIIGTNQNTGAESHGTLNLCDLAGSERLGSKSGFGSPESAKRVKETQSINKSLSCLGDVFHSLHNGSSHIPFRNSKLTHLLQNCLSGDGKALMFVNLSPTEGSYNESLCSLRFAQRVGQIELGKAKKNVKIKKKKDVPVRSR